MYLNRTNKSILTINPIDELVDNGSRLYNIAGNLYFNGQQVGTGSGSGDADTVQDNLDAFATTVNAAYAANDYATYVTLQSNINTIQSNVSALPDSAANDYTTYTILTANSYNTYIAATNYADTAISNLVNSAPATLDTLNEIAIALGNDANLSTTLTSAIGNNTTAINTVNANVNALPDSAANDYATYVTINSLINTVQSNVQLSNDWANANDYNTYSSLILDIIALQSSRAFNTWVNSNDYATYTVLQSNINTVQSNISALDNNAWVNANDYATYVAATAYTDNVVTNVATSTMVAFSDTFAVDGSTNAFTMSAAAISPSALLVYYDGLLQHDDTYVVAGNILTLSNTDPLPSGKLSVRALVQNSEILNNNYAFANDYATYTTLVSLISNSSSDVANSWVNANDYSTYSTLISEINTVNSNVNALPDSAANDYVTYTILTANSYNTYVAATSYTDTAISNLVASAPATLDTLNEIAIALGNDANLSTTLTSAIGNNTTAINTVNANVDALPDSAANDYATYTLLQSNINTVQSNVSALPDSAANDYSTYTVLQSNINTVSANISALPDSAANDYTTYTTLTANIYNTYTYLEANTGTGGAINDVFYENANTVNANYTISVGKNAMSAGPIQIDANVVVSVPTGSRWAIV